MRLLPDQANDALQRAIGKTDAVVGRVMRVDGEAGLPALDALLVEAGYQGLGSRWARVPSERAEALLVALLARDDFMMFVGRGRARQIARKFVTLFGPEPAFYTNVARTEDWTDGAATSFGWDPISSYTFDWGMAGIGAGRVGFAWGFGED